MNTISEHIQDAELYSYITMILNAKWRGYQKYHDDLKQECVMACWKRLPSFDPNRAQVHTYISMICFSTITAYFKPSRNRDVSDEDKTGEGDHCYHRIAPGAEAEDNSDDGYRSIVRNERSKLLVEAVPYLNRTQREALHDTLKGLTAKEQAALRGKSSGWRSKSYHDAIDVIRGLVVRNNLQV